MKSKNIFRTILAGFFLAFLISFSATAENQNILKVHNGNFESALNAASQNNQLVFVKVYTDWCGWCKRMDSRTLGDESVISHLNENFVTLKIDAEKGEGPAFSETHQAKNYPTILFFAPTGELVHSFKGFKNADNFLKEAALAQEKYNNAK